MWQGMDQRRFPRANYRCVVALRQEGKPIAVSTVTQNVGLGGICALLEKSFDIFSTVDLELSLDDGKPPIQVQGTVVWVVQRRDVKKGPSFDTGVEFADLSTEDKSRVEAVIDKALSKK